MAASPLHAHLLQLVAAQLITAAGGDEFAFRHALVGEAVYATLLRRERLAIHRAVAQVLEGLYAGALDDYLPVLAYHYYQAGAWDQALTFARLAGEQAERRHAPHEAHAQYTRALEAAEKLPAGRGAPPGLYRARGQVHELLGDFTGAATDYAAALEAARAAGDGHAEWQTLLDLGVLWAGRDYDRTGDYFQRALGQARALGDPATLGRSLNRLGNWHLNREEAQAALALHQEALALFEPGADRHGLAETLDLLGLTWMILGDPFASRAAYLRALALFRELDDRRGQASSLALMATNFASDTAAAAISPAQALANSEQSLRLARAIGWRAGEAYALLNRGALWLATGDFEIARQSIIQGQTVAGEIGHRQWQTMAMVVLGNYYAQQLDYALARQRLAEACTLARQVNSVLWIRFSGSALASACVALGDLAAAEAALAGLPAAARPRTQGERLVAAAWVELALA
ncbi:MAG: hypothetical protein IT318_21205, partial [Anaerolineales bacterium]|nr:hypothetical protein [Anaerolineales bacterium]